jgi:WD repeat-containing protein 61
MVQVYSINLIFEARIKEMNKKIQVVKLARFSGHSGSIYGLYYSTSKNKIYTGGAEGYVVEWNPNEPESGVLVARLALPVYSIFLVEETQILWIGTSSGNIHLIDLKQGKEIRNIAVHQLGVFDLKELNGIIYAGGGDGKISSHNSETGDLINIIKVSDKSIRTLAIDSNIQQLVYGSSDWSIGLLSKNLEFLYRLEKAHQNSVFSLAISPNGEYLLSGGRDAMLKIWQLGNDLKLVQEMPAHNLHVHAISMHQENGYFLTSSMDKSIKIWSVEDFTLLKVMDKMRNESHINSVNKIAWIDDVTFLSVGDDKIMFMWRLIS